MSAVFPGTYDYTSSVSNGSENSWPLFGPALTEKAATNFPTQPWPKGGNHTKSRPYSRESRTQGSRLTAIGGIGSSKDNLTAFSSHGIGMPRFPSSDSVK